MTKSEFNSFAQYLMVNPIVLPKELKPVDNRNIKKKKNGYKQILVLSDIQAGQEPVWKVGEQFDIILNETVEFKKHYKVDKLAIILCGDMVEGTTIYKGQGVDVFFNTKKQIESILLHFIPRLIHELSKEYTSIDIFCVPGNHGRVMGTNPHSDDNMDSLFYLCLSCLYEENKKVRVNRTDKGHLYSKEYGFVTEHGDKGIKTTASSPYYAIDRKSMMQAAKYPNMTMYIIGHWHKALSKSVRLGSRKFNVYVNGTFLSNSKYEEDNFVTQGSLEQFTIITDEENRVVSEKRINIDVG